MTKPQLPESDLDCLRSLLKTAHALGIPIFAVGATARWLVFNLPNNIPLHRTTTDWDFGVRVADWDQFRRLRQNLLEQATQFHNGRYEHELIHVTSGLKIDLVPFGGLENDGRIRWPESAFEMNVLGFSDALENAIQLDLAPDLKLPVATVPLLVALKFFAYADRKKETDRDLSDLWHVIQHYVMEGRENELFENPLAPLVGEDFDWQYARPLLLGHDVGHACKPMTVERLLPILQELGNPYADGISTLIGRSFSADEEEAERQRVSESFVWLMKALELHRQPSTGTST